METFMASLSREQIGMLWIISSTLFAVLFIAVLAIIFELDRKQVATQGSKRKGAAR